MKNTSTPKLKLFLLKIWHFYQNQRILREELKVLKKILMNAKILHILELLTLFETNSNFLIPISLQPYGVKLWFFKLRPLDLAEFIVWNTKRIKHWVAKILRLENFSFWLRLNFFREKNCEMRMKIFAFFRERFRSVHFWI